jgi:hypothetical protein
MFSNLLTNTRSAKSAPAEPVEFTIPEWAVSYLINGDCSGLNECDINAADDFVRRTHARFGNALFTTPADADFYLDFRWMNDVDQYAGTCYKLLIVPSR